MKMSHHRTRALFLCLCAPLAWAGPTACGDDAGNDGGTDADADTGADADADAGADADADADADSDADADVDADADGDAGTVERPGYNTGTGFFVVGNKLYDANGVEFRIRGVNKCHYDAAWPGIPKAHANTIRWGVPLWLDPSVPGGLMRDTIDAGLIPMAGIWYTAGSWADEDNVTCKEDTAIFETAVGQWEAHADTFKPFERNLLVNIANEWGPADSTVWRDAYVAAVARLRAAGYLGALIIDAGGCGQDAYDIVHYGREVFDSDPQRNIVFDVHIYGLWADGDGESWQTDLTTGLDALAATGLPFFIGEFGPGRNIGPSPTMMTPGRIIQACDARGVGWMAWAWDDPAYGATDDSFALSYYGDYDGTDDLTTYGKEVVENPSYGLLALARPATTF
jgi:mannan endo-1,4-beta-mannosidase